MADDVEGVREELPEPPEGPTVQAGYVKYPPRYWDAPPSLAITNKELPQDYWQLHLKDASWRSTGNPVWAVESIIMRHRAGVFPSVAAMEWLAEGLEDWHNHHGHKSLEQCLGLRLSRGHTANQMKEATREQIVQSLLLRMLHLRCAFGLQIKDAAAVLAAWMEEPAWNSSSHNFKPLSEDTLQDYWKACRWVKDQEANEFLRRLYQDDAARRELLADYPRWAWQHLPELKGYR
ncbi:MAG: hypothetical protein ACK2U9_03275 [Anaerolineae bacterium]